MISAIISLIRIDANSHSTIITLVVTKVVTDLIINDNTMTAVRIITVMVVEVTLLTTIIIGSRYLTTKYRCAIRIWSLALIVELKIHVR